MKIDKFFKGMLGAAFLLLATTAQADIILGSGSGDVLTTATQAESDYPGTACDPSSNSNTDITNCLAVMGISGEVYKDDYDDGVESFILAGSYDVTYDDCFTQSDGSVECHSFTITYTGGDIATDAYLLVKDGNNDPEWYLFDLTDWDGTETIVVNCLWGSLNGECTPTGGSISHVSLFGGTEVPEPGTLALLGIGLLGMGAARRRKAA